MALNPIDSSVSDAPRTDSLGFDPSSRWLSCKVCPGHIAGLRPAGWRGLAAGNVFGLLPLARGPRSHLGPGPRGAGRIPARDRSPIAGFPPGPLRREKGPPSLRAILTRPEPGHMKRAHPRPPFWHGLGGTPSTCLGLHDLSPYGPEDSDTLFRTSPAGLAPSGSSRGSQAPGRPVPFAAAVAPPETGGITCWTRTKAVSGCPAIGWLKSSATR